MLAITVDLDWAPEEVIEDILEILDVGGIRCTFFVTHESPALRHACHHELALHPNFTNGADPKQELARVLDIVPDARGVRCHGYHQSSRILDLFADHGIVYDSNLVAFEEESVSPFCHWNGIVRLPVFWEDDVNCIAGHHWDPSVYQCIQGAGIYVFAFHPIHVYLNTKSLADYVLAKPDYHQPDRLERRRNPERSGVGTRVFLKRLIELIAEKGLQTGKLLEIARSFREVTPLAGGGK